MELLPQPRGPRGLEGQRLLVGLPSGPCCFCRKEGVSHQRAACGGSNTQQALRWGQQLGSLDSSARVWEWTGQTGQCQSRLFCLFQRCVPVFLSVHFPPWVERPG